MQGSSLYSSHTIPHHLPSVIFIALHTILVLHRLASLDLFISLPLVLNHAIFFSLIAFLLVQLLMRCNVPANKQPKLN